MHEQLSRFICNTFLFIMISILFFIFPDKSIQAQYYDDSEIEELGSMITLYSLDSALDLRLESEKDDEKNYTKVDNKRGDLISTFNQDRLTYEERINLQGNGYSYHPNFLELNFFTSFGLRQQNESGDLKENEDEFFHENSIDLGFFRTKQFHFNLFSNRYSTTIDRDFFDSIDVDTSMYGGLFQNSHDKFPMSLLLQTQETEESSMDYKRDRNERTAEYKVSNKIEEMLNSTFRYTYKKIIEKFPSDQTFIRHNVNLTNSLVYENINGTSDISYYKTSDEFNNEQLQIFESFYADHTETLRSLYNYNYSYFKTEDFDTKRHYSEFGLHHTLYDSLDTELRGVISDTRSTDGTEFYSGPKFYLQYRKIVPGGRFSAGYNVFYRKTDSDFEQGIQRVFGERIILADEEITYLANINVVLDSVIVRDESGLILIPNMDYSLSVHGALVEIKREDLPNNTAVLVDYEYEVPKELDYDSLITGVSLRYDFRQFFALYYNYSSTDHNIHTDLSKFDSVSPLQEEKVSLYGSEFKWRWFDLDAEYEDDSSDLVPFKGWRVRGNFKLYPADSIAFNLNGSHSKIRYQEEKRDVTFNHIEASLNYRFSNLLEAEFRAGYFKEYGDDTDDRVIKFNADVTSRFREIELQLETEYMNRDEITEDRDELTIRFKFVRYFHLI